MIRPAKTPLSPSPLVSRDPETTDLQLARGRIVQISAITIEETELHFDMLVNPNLPISANSTAIHGLRTSDRQGAQRCQPWWRPDYFFRGGQNRKLALSFEGQSAVTGYHNLAGVGYFAQRDTEV